MKQDWDALSTTGLVAAIGGTLLFIWVSASGAWLGFVGMGMGALAGFQSSGFSPLAKRFGNAWAYGLAGGYIGILLSAPFVGD